MEHLLLCSQNILFVLAVALRSCVFVFFIFVHLILFILVFVCYLFICLVLLLALFLDNFVCIIIIIDVAYVNVRVSRRLKEELAWVIDKRLRVISNKMLFKTVVPLRN